MAAHVMSGQLLEDPPLGLRRSRIDEPVADRVYVDRFAGVS
jgi:hypothetical protein